MAVVAAGVLVSTVVIRTQFLGTVTVTSDSMAPTVCTGDTLVVARLADGRAVRSGDIVIFASPVGGAATIKRVVAVAGQTVSMQDAQLIVDGARVTEPYVDHASIDGVYFGRVLVPAGDVFVLGDRRETSIDSRAYGPIPQSSIIGRMLWKLWSRC